MWCQDKKGIAHNIIRLDGFKFISRDDACCQSKKATLKKQGIKF